MAFVVALWAGLVTCSNSIAAMTAGSGALATTVYLGYALPWDQMALWAVTVGSDMAGFTPVFGDDVRFDLFFGEVRGGSLIWFERMHEWFLPAALVLAGTYLSWLAWSRVRDSRQ